jgi:hypothetical protein
MSEYEEGALAAHHFMDELAKMSGPFLQGFASFATDTRALFALVPESKTLDVYDPDEFAYGRQQAEETAANLVQQSAGWKAGWSATLKAPAVEAAKRADFERRVVDRIAETKAVNALVEHKLAPTVVPKPRTPSLDRLEIARITKLREAREIKSRADRLVQAHRVARGEAAFVVMNDGVPIPADPVAIRAFVHQQSTEIGQAKDAMPVLEFRNALGVAE